MTVMPNKLQRDQTIRDIFAHNNLAINSAFNVWLRGTSFGSSSSRRVLADEWVQVAGTGTASQGSGYPGGSGLSLVPSVTMDVQQGIIDYKSFGGNWVSVSAWVQSAGSGCDTVLYIKGFDGGSSTWSGVTSDVHPGDGGWYRLTATLQLPATLGNSPTGTPPHASGVVFGITSSYACTLSGVTFVLGRCDDRFTDGLPYIPTPRIQDELHCAAFYETGTAMNTQKWIHYSGRPEDINIWIGTTVNFSVKKFLTPSVSGTGVSNISQSGFTTYASAAGGASPGSGVGGTFTWVAEVTY